MKSKWKISYPHGFAARRLILALVVLFFLRSGCLPGQIRPVSPDSATSGLQEYGSLFPLEKIYVHTDREEYIAGENLWFSLYLFEGQAGKLSSSSEIAYLEILNPGNSPVVQSRIRLDKGLGSGLAVLSDTLGSGAYTLRAYTSSMKNLMPGNCFSKVINIYNILNTKNFVAVSHGEAEAESRSAGRPSDERKVSKSPVANQLIELSDPGPVGIRERIVLEFQLGKSGETSGQVGNFSVSVSPCGSNPAPDIDEYLFSGSDNRRISRTAVSPGNYPGLIYKAENEYHFLRGQLIDRSGQGLDSGRYMFLSIPGKSALFQYSLTDNEGWFEFSIPITDGRNNFIIQPEDPGTNDAIRMESSFSDRYPSSAPLASSQGSATAPHIAKWSVNYQLRRIFSTDSVLPPVESGSYGLPAKRFYGRPETELFLKDYIDLPLMEEVFYELLSGVQLRSRRSGYEITMTDPVYNKQYEKSPVTFVDGVVVRDPSVIAGLDPAKVEKIDVIRSRYVVGDYLFFGLVNVITGAGDFSDIALPEYAVRLPYRIFEPEPRFWSPSYTDPESRQSRIPDLRNTLYWNPSVRPGSDGRFSVEFWSSDYVTNYEVNIQGVDSNGEPLSFHKTIMAK